MGQRPPDLAALGLVRLPRSSAERNDRRPRLLSERCPLNGGASEDECARRCVQPLAHLMSCKCVDAERRNTEVEPDGARKDAAVIDLVDLVNLRHRVTAHSAVLPQVVWGHLATQSNEHPGTARPPCRGDTADARLGQ